MNITLIITQVLGIIFSILGLSMLVNKKNMATVVEDMLHSQGLFWLTGLATLTIGVVMIGLNNGWNSGLQSVITIIGWLILIKGTAILLIPKTMTLFYKKFVKDSMLIWAGLIILILGLLLVYKGF